MGTFKAAYVGEAEGDIEAFGTTFPEGKSADVDERFRDKVEGNPFFKTGAAPKSSGGKDDGKSTLEAKHRGGGSYSIMDGDTEVMEKLTKEDAEAFNGLSDEEKAEYVKAKN